MVRHSGNWFAVVIGAAAWRKESLAPGFYKPGVPAVREGKRFRSPGLIADALDELPMRISL